MLRSQIPDRLAKARASDIDRVPARVMKALSYGDLVNRLNAASEFRRRATSVPHLDGDLYRHRISQASEVLTTADPRRAADLIKAAGVSATPEQEAAGVPGWVHRPFNGEHTHEHAAWGASDADRDGGHDHSHVHRNDANHHHRHAAMSAKSTRQAPAIRTPALDLLAVKAAAAQSVARAMAALAADGRLGDLERDIARLRTELASGRVRFRDGLLAKSTAAVIGLGRERAEGAATAAGPLAKAAGYRRKADVVSDPVLRKSYLQLAEQLETAGAR